MNYLKKNALPLVIFMILSITSIWAAYGFNENMYLSSDGFFHYYRFEYLYKNVSELNFFNDFYIDGYLYDLGYPTGIFYPQMLYYPFVTLALLLNLTPEKGFLLALILILFCIFWSSYEAVKRFNEAEREDSKLKLIGFLGALVYVFLPTLIPIDFSRPINSYLTFNISARHSIAEVIAFIFFPWVIVGMQRLFSKKGGQVLLFALLGVLYSHILSGVFVGIGILLYCGFRAKEIVRDKKTFKELWKVLGLFLLLGAYQIFPILEMMLFQDYAYNIPLFDTGTLLEHALPFSLVGENIPDSFLAFQLFFGALVIFLFTRVKDKHHLMIKLGILGLYVSSIFFPWQLFEGTAVGFIQFPSRLTTILSLFWSFSLVIVLKADKLKTVRYSLCVLFLIVILMNLANSFNIRTHQLRDISTADLENRYGTVITVGHGAEYLPAEFDVNDGMYKHKDAFRISYVTTKMPMLIKKAKEDMYLLPRFYYKGYKIIVGGKVIPHKVGYSGLIQTEEPIDEGKVRIIRERSIIQNASFAVSIVSLIGYFYVYTRRKYKQSHKEPI